MIRITNQMNGLFIIYLYLYDPQIIIKALIIKKIFNFYYSFFHIFISFILIIYVKKSKFF